MVLEVIIFRGFIIYILSGESIRFGCRGFFLGYISFGGVWSGCFV